MFLTKKDEFLTNNVYIETEEAVKTLKYKISTFYCNRCSRKNTEFL